MAMGLSLIIILFSYSTAFAEWIGITLESYDPATLPTVSTIIEVADPNDQLEISRQAVLFALRSEGWNLENLGFNLDSREPPEWSGHIYWASADVGGLDSDISKLLGYDLNDEALTYGPTFFLWFHTDEWVARGSHDICESENNYGVMSGGMGGVFTQCTVADWGRFTVQLLTEPLPDIKVNSEDNHIVLTTDDVVSVTASLSPGSFAGFRVDWWVGALTTFGTYWVNRSLQWVKSDTPISIGQVGLEEVQEVELLNSTLPVGIYTFFFAIDAKPDGVFGITWQDIVNMTINNGDN
jgi:hypothetical protein